MLVTFNVDDDIEVGDRTEAAIKTKSLLGAKFLEVTPRGEGTQSGTIPVERTSSPYQLPDALGDLAATIRGLNTNQVSDSLTGAGGHLQRHPADVKVAVQGVARFSQTLDERDAQLRNLLANANKVTGVLAERSDQVVSLIADTNALLVQLQNQSSALDQISGSISARHPPDQGHHRRQPQHPQTRAGQTQRRPDDHRQPQGTSAGRRSNDSTPTPCRWASPCPLVRSSRPTWPTCYPVSSCSRSSTPRSPTSDWIPNVLSPSQRLDPQTGQPGTPALPIPFPRTGQGGEPNLHLPDAITGNPGDARYPYREPLPAPPPGGPPPGPPATIPPEPTTAPLYVPAPNEPAPMHRHRAARRPARCRRRPPQVASDEHDGSPGSGWPRRWWRR